MRNLQTRDVFKMARIIKTADIKDKLLDIYNGADKSQQQVGVEFFLVLIESCANPKQEEAIYEFIAGVMEKTPEQIAEQDLDKLLEDISELSKNNNLVDFFKKAQNLTN